MGHFPEVLPFSDTKDLFPEAETHIKLLQAQLAALYTDQTEHEYQLHAVVVQEGERKPGKVCFHSRRLLTYRKCRKRGVRTLLGFNMGPIQPTVAEV